MKYYLSCRADHGHIELHHPENRKASFITINVEKITSVHKNRLDTPDLKKSKNGSLWQQFLWCLTLLLSTCALVYQMADRISYYFSEPTATQIKLTQNRTITLPDISLCFGPNESYRVLAKTFRSIVCDGQDLDNCENDPNVTNVDFHAMNMTMAKLMPYMGADSGMIISIIKMCTDYMMSCSIDFPFEVKSHDFMEAWGNCTTISFVNPVEFNYGYTLQLSISIDELSSVKDIDYVKFFFHPPGEWPTLDEIYAVQPIRDDKTHLIYEFSVNQFSFISTKNNPCDEPTQVIRKVNRCIKDILTEHLPCSVPSLSRENLPTCNSLAEVEAATKYIEEVVNSKSLVTCYYGNRMCRQTLYGMQSGAFIRYGALKQREGSANMHQVFNPLIEIVFYNNVFQSTHEVATYSFTALVSDVSGNAGFFLGICVLSIVTFVEKIASLIIDRVG